MTIAALDATAPAAGRNPRPGIVVKPCTAATAKPPRGVGARMRVIGRYETPFSARNRDPTPLG